MLHCFPTHFKQRWLWYISEGCQITSTGFFSEIPFDVSSLHSTFWLDLTSNHRCLTGPRSLEVLTHDEVTATKGNKGKSKKGGKGTEKPLCETHQVMVVTGCFGRHIWKAWETVLIQGCWPMISFPDEKWKSMMDNITKMSSKSVVFRRGIARLLLISRSTHDLRQLVLGVFALFNWEWITWCKGFQNFVARIFDI